MLIGLILIKFDWLKIYPVITQLFNNNTPNEIIIIYLFLVPQGCGHYFTGNSGTIYSFNYPNGMYIAGVNYGICFRKERGNCGYILRDQGPSWIGCSDLFRIPSNNYPTDSVTFPFCLNPAPSSKNSYPVSRWIRPPSLRESTPY